MNKKLTKDFGVQARGHGNGLISAREVQQNFVVNLSGSTKLVFSFLAHLRGVQVARDFDGQVFRLASLVIKD